MEDNQYGRNVRYHAAAIFVMFPEFEHDYSAESLITKKGPAYFPSSLALVTYIKYGRRARISNNKLHCD